MRKHVLYARSEKWRAVAERAGEIIGSSGFQLLKRTPTSAAGFLLCGAEPHAFLKHTTVRSWIAGLWLRVRGSRAARWLRGAAMLERAALLHPQPLAAVELLSAGAIRSSCVIVEPLTTARTLSIFALGPSGGLASDYRRRKKISDTVAAEVRRLHDSGLYTLDLQETNLMVEAHGRGFRVYFVDLEDFRPARSVSRRLRILNLVHLDRSIGRFMCRAARLDFLYSYMGGRPADREARRTMVQEILRVRARVERRHRARRGKRLCGRPATLTAASRDDARGRRPGLMSSGR